MTQPLLHSLDVRARPNQQRSLCVSELVQVVADIGSFAPAFPSRRVRVPNRRPELSKTVVGEVLAAPAVERVGIHELVQGVCADRRLLVLVEACDLHRTSLLLLPLRKERYCSVIEPEPAVRLLALRVADLMVGGVLLAHIHALALEVDVAPHEPENLSSAHARRECNPDRHSIARLLLGAKRHCKLKGLLVGERLTLLGLRSWRFHVSAWVRPYEPVRDCLVHDERERGVELVERALRCLLRREELVVLVRHLLESEVLKQRVTPEVFDLSNLELVVLEGERRVPA